MDELYGHSCPRCGGFTDAATEVTFSTEVLSRMLRDIYDGMDVRGQVQRDAFDETLRLFNGATAEGLSQASWQDYGDLFLEQLRTGNEVFSAFRVHRMQNDMAARLLDEDGQLKPFDRWLEDIRDISSHYNVSWLRTEYDTAVIRAQQAAEWKQFRSEEDVYPNLRWMPTTSPEPDAGHRQYWQARLTLPVGHPFWQQHRPGDRWNCKCSLEQTDEPATADAVADFTPVPPVDGLEGNPADDGRLFSASHPYFTQAHPGAGEAVERLLDRIYLRTAGSDALTRKVTHTEEEIRTNRKFETGVAFDMDGNIVVDKRGQAFTVNFTEEECRSMKNCIFTHNHPRGWAAPSGSIARTGNSFSIEDVEFAIFNDLEEIRAVTPVYTFSLKRPKGGWSDVGSVRTFHSRMSRENRKLYNELNDNIYKGYISAEWAQTLHYHLLWKRVSKKMGWEYRKLKTGNNGQGTTD